MVNFEKTIKIEVKSDLLLNFESENMGISVEGYDTKGDGTEGDDTERNGTKECEIYIKMISDGNLEEDEFDSLIHIDYDESANKLDLRSDEPSNLKYVDYTLKVKVPQVCEVKAETENGAIVLKKLHGIQTVESENGPCKFTDIQGDIICKVENSPIAIYNCESHLKLNSENGPIKLVEFKGKVTIEAENSPIKIGNSEGEIKLTTQNSMVRILGSGFKTANIETENGSIYYEFAPLEEGEFKFKSENGKITLVIPEDIPFDIHARNQIGKMHIGLKGEYDVKNEGDVRIVEMVRGSGKVDIKVENYIGSIRMIPNKKEFKEFNINFMGDILEGVYPTISKENMEKVKKKLEKVKIKMDKIKIPDVEKIVERVEIEVKKAMEKVSQDDFLKDKATQIKYEISEAVGKVHKKMVEKDLNSHEKAEVNERSRIKILELLEKGTITADEAERLLNAMEGHDAR